MVSCTVIVPAGSALEDAKTNGAAHCLEHLLFNGTTSRSREEIYARTDELGAYNNASTQRERTVFQLLLPSENWREGVELQADMILHSTLPQAMFEKEKGIILEELAKDRSSPGYEADLFLMQSLYGSDAHALPTLGTKESITGLELEALRKFYRETYVPERMTVVFMGDFEEAQGREEIARLYGKEKATRSKTKQPPFPAGRHIVSRSFPDLTTTRVTVMFPMPPVDDPNAAAGFLLADVLGEGERAAVSRAIEAACGPVISSAASFEAGPGWSLLTIGVELDAKSKGGEAPGSSIPAAGAILTHLADLSSRADWLDDVAVARIDRSVQEISLREKMHYFGLERADLLSSSDARIALEMPARIQGVDAAIVQEWIAGAMKGPILVVGAGPGIAEEHAAIPGDWPALKKAAAAKSSKSIAAAAMQRTPQTSKVEVARTVRSGGLTLIVHSSPGAETLAIHALLRNRAALEEKSGVPAGTSDVIHRMMELGTESKTKDELRGALSRIGATLKVTDADMIPYDDYYFSPEYSYVRLESIGAFAKEAIGLFAEVLWHPRMDEATLRQAIASASARAERERTSPGANADRLFFASLDPKHPRARGIYDDPAALESLDVPSVIRHHQVMTNPSNVILCISSSLPGEDIERMLDEAANLTAPSGSSETQNESSAKSGEKSSAAAVATQTSQGRREVAVETGQEQSAIIVGQPLSASDQDPALRIAVAMLSERLADRLRERESLAYSIGASLRLDEPGKCVLMSAGTRPENLERMEKGMREVAAELAVKIPTQREMDGARNRAEGQSRMRRLTRIGQAYALSMAELRGRAPDQLDADLAALRAVSPQQVQAAAKRALTFESSIVAIAR
jgi:zinc protease